MSDLVDENNILSYTVSYLEADNSNLALKMYFKALPQMSYDTRVLLLNLFSVWVDRFRYNQNLKALSTSATVFVTEPGYEHVYDTICRYIKEVINRRHRMNNF